MKILIFFNCLLFAIFLYSQGGVGINNSGAMPSSLAILDVIYSSKGLLIPRVSLTSTADITTITNGNVLSLLVFNTATVSDVTPDYYYWNGFVWKTLGEDADFDSTNEIELPTGGTTGQVLSTNGTGVYSWIADNLGTDTQNITESSFNASTGDLVIGIQNGTSQTLNFNGLKDHDWYKVGTTTAPITINDNVFTQGSVGIGLINPTEKLDVFGNTKINNTVASLIIKDTDATVSTDGMHSNILFRDQNENLLGIIGFATSIQGLSIQNKNVNGGIHWSVGGTVNNMYLSPTGDLGIGTTTPTQKLEVQGSVKIVNGTQGLGKIFMSDATGSELGKIIRDSLG